MTVFVPEELHALAKDFDAEVVYCEKRFETDADGTNIRVKTDQPKVPLVDKPTFESHDLTQRIQVLTNDGYCVTLAKKFLRVPNVVYLWRQVEDSLSHKKRSPQRSVTFWMEPLLFGFRQVDAFLNR